MHPLNRYAPGTFLAVTLFFLAGCSQAPPQAPASELVAAAPAQSTDKVATPVAQNTAVAPPVSVSVAPPPPAPTPVAPKKYDGPFGLAPGMSVAQAQEIMPNLEKKEEGIYKTHTPPIAHESFETYLLTFSNTSGLCATTAIGKNIETGNDGYEVRREINELSDALTERYGIGKEYDAFVEPWGDTKYWMLALTQKNRTFAKIWSAESGATLPSQISSIGTMASAVDMNTGYVTLRYEYSNFNECENEQKLARNKAL